MTTTMPDSVTVPVASPRLVQPAGRRVIGVGIRQVRRDAAALRWAMFDARPAHDIVVVLHAVQSAGLAYTSGWDEIATAVGLASRQRPGVAVIGSPTAGSAEQVLQDQSDQVAVLVLGQDDPYRPHRRIAAHLRKTAHCPVVCVPPGTEIVDDLPVTVVDDNLAECEAAMDFAARYAERHHTGLRIIHAWRSPHHRATGHSAVADQRTGVDADLEALRASHPHVSVSADVEGDENGLQQLRGQSSLIVVGRDTIRSLSHAAPLPSEPPCAVAFIPDRWLAPQG